MMKLLMDPMAKKTEEVVMKVKVSPTEGLHEPISETLKKLDSNIEATFIKQAPSKPLSTITS
jgi:hypothetical protein